MVAKAVTISESQFRLRFLRSGLRNFRAGSGLQSAALPPHARCTMRDAECWRGPAGGKKQYYLDQEIALYLLGSGNNGRYYDAVTGRFLSEDPTQQDGTSKDSNSQLLTSNSSADVNLYCYTGNDPVNNLDPSGHSLVTDPPKRDFHPVQNQPTHQHNAKSQSQSTASVAPAVPEGESSGTKKAAGHAPHRAGGPTQERTPRFLAKGVTVQEVQKIVGVTTDGIYGPKTRAAVVRFQEMLISRHFLQGNADGEWGPETQKAYELYEESRHTGHSATTQGANLPAQENIATTHPAKRSVPHHVKLPPVPKPPLNHSLAAREARVREMAAYIDAWFRAHGIKGLDGKTLAAQFAAENDWGFNKQAQDSNNRGNIKGKGPAGSQMRGQKGPFRKYHTLGEFLADCAKVVRRTYPQAIGKSGAAYYNALQSGRYRYSTNPHYSQFLTTIYNQVFEKGHR